MKRLLYIAIAPPLPANSGQRMRTWAMLRALAAEGHEVHFVTFAEPSALASHSAELAHVCKTVEAVPLMLTSWSSGGDYVRRLRSLFTSVPYGVERFRSALMAERLATRLHEHFDAVIADSIYAVVNLPNTLEPPLIIDDNNIEHMILKRYILQERNPIRRAYGWLEWRKVRKWEQTVCTRSALVIVCSENDRSTMREMCPKPMVTMVPNSVDLCSYRIAPPCVNATALYIGSMDWFPNRHAVEFFVTEILPELRRRVPLIKFKVIYSQEHAPSEGFREKFVGVPNIEFAETNDVRTEIANAALFVVPLRIGSGTRFKILEAGAIGKPIVSTRVGAEGLDFRNGEEILIADDPVDFARVAAAVLVDPSRQATLSLGARRRVEQQYDFIVLQQTLAHALTEVGAHQPQRIPRTSSRKKHGPSSRLKRMPPRGIPL